MSTFLIVDISVHDRDRFMEYVKLVPPCIAKHKGKYRFRGGEIEVWEGDWKPQRLVVLEFPSREHAKAFLEDPDYQPIAAIRHEAATTNLIIIDEYTEH